MFSVKFCDSERYFRFVSSDVGLTTLFVMTGAGPVTAILLVIAPRIRVIPKHQHALTSFISGRYDECFCKTK